MDKIDRAILEADIAHYKFKASLISRSAPNLIIDVMLGSPFPLIYFDFQGKFAVVSRKFADMLGYEPIDLEGEDILPLVHEDDLLPTAEAMAYATKGVDPRGFVNRYRCNNGSYKWIYWFPQPQAQDGIYGPAFAAEIINIPDDIVAGFAPDDILDRIDYKI